MTKAEAKALAAGLAMIRLGQTVSDTGGEPQPQLLQLLMTRPQLLPFPR
jgi:hypothetical protein